MADKFIDYLVNIGPILASCIQLMLMAITERLLQTDLLRVCVIMPSDEIEIKRIVQDLLPTKSPECVHYTYR